jgi:surface antigen
VTTTVQLFRCHPLSCALTREACAAKHRIESGRAARSQCTRCEIGAAHARGEAPEQWPNGAPVETLTREITGKLVPLGALVHGQRDCRHCGRAFGRRGHRQIYCGVFCAGAAARQRRAQAEVDAA